MAKKISISTRQGILDEMKIANILYHGDETEPDFLNRLFDLKSLPAKKDPRYDNAYGDIYQHTVNNSDYSYNWIYSDPRINLLHCEDETYLKFLEHTLHPVVRTNPDELNTLLELYNKHLDGDGFEIAHTKEIAGKPLFSGRKKIFGQSLLSAQKVEIKKYLNTEYVSGKISMMNEAVNTNTELAIGTAKELIETMCKSILKQKGKNYSVDWDTKTLLNETTKILGFKHNTHSKGDEESKAQEGIRKILSGISVIVHGVVEVRNAYGTGHGKESNFQGLEPKYAKLLVGVVADILIFYLATNGETAELVEDLEDSF